MPLNLLQCFTNFPNLRWAFLIPSSYFTLFPYRLVWIREIHLLFVIEQVRTKLKTFLLTPQKTFFLTPKKKTL